MIIQYIYWFQFFNTFGSNLVLVKQYRFRINDHERTIIIGALKIVLDSFKKQKESSQRQSLESLKQHYDINSNEITKEDILDAFDCNIKLVSNLINGFENPKRGRKRVYIQNT